MVILSKFAPRHGVTFAVYCRIHSNGKFSFTTFLPDSWVLSTPLDKMGDKQDSDGSSAGSPATATSPSDTPPSHTDHNHKGMHPPGADHQGVPGASPPFIGSPNAGNSPDPVHDLPIELLQAGWRKFWSRRENRPYFFNKMTNQSMWEMPQLTCMVS
jgi:hypothetical protein